MGFRHIGSDDDGNMTYRYSGYPCESCGDSGYVDEEDRESHDYCSECYAGEYMRDYRRGTCDYIPTCSDETCITCGPVDINDGRGNDYYRTGREAPVKATVGEPVSASTVTTPVAERVLSDSEAFNFAAFDTWNIIEEIVGVNPDKLLLWGPPGTGKSTVCQTVALGGRKCYPITMTEEMPAEVLKGHLIPIGNEFQWMDGMGTAAMRTNPITGLAGRLVVNEIDKACGDALDILNLFCDDPAVAELTLPKQDLEVVKPGFGYQVFACMNGHPSTLSEALQDRFPATIPVEEVNEAAIKRLPEDLQSVARVSSIASGQRRVGIRKWMMFASLREKLSAPIAAFACFGRDGATVLAQIEMANK